MHDYSDVVSFLSKKKRIFNVHPYGHGGYLGLPAECRQVHKNVHLKNNTRILHNNYVLLESLVSRVPYNNFVDIDSSIH